MRETALVPLNLGGFVAFFAALAIVIGVLLWYLNRREKQAREKFFDQFDAEELRMSPYKIGIVYRVLSMGETDLTVVPVWDGRAQVLSEAQLNLPHDAVVAFDKSRFF